MTGERALLRVVNDDIYLLKWEDELIGFDIIDIIIIGSSTSIERSQDHRK